MFFNVTFAEILMVVLTCIIAGAVIAQSWYMRLQTKVMQSQAKHTEALTNLAVETEKRARERDTPTIRISHKGRSFTDGTTLEGFTLTNASPFAVIITHFSFGLGVPVDEEGKIIGPFTPAMDVRPIHSYKGKVISDWSFPRRLQYGESMYALFDPEEVRQSLEPILGKDRPLRFRPQCYDSLGKRHVMSGWVSWEAPNTIAVFEDPGPDLVPYPY